MRSQALVGVRLYKQKVAPAAHTSKASDAKSPKLQLVGKIHVAVVDPAGTHVVGFMVKQSDIAGMVKREDVFVGLVDMRPLEDKSGLVVLDTPDAFNKAAAQKAGVDLDLCVLWEGMDAKTQAGKPLGYVRDLEFADKNGELEALYLTEGGMSDALVGALKVPMSDVMRYENFHIIVRDSVPASEREGGAAAVAGEAAAKAQENVYKAGAAAARATDKAVNRGARELGKLIGKAKICVKEATQDEPDYPELPAQDVKVSSVGNEKSVNNVQTSSEKRSPAAKIRDNASKAPAKKSAADQLARGLGKSLRGTKGMFSSFKKEFDKHSKLSAAHTYVTNVAKTQHER